ncbi:hypothetical protein DFJ58DRAFT_848010 [Suillus subalutaceus]|uniref:uncharacterized protein n=1 Tax=Suillus subalutaceus TaxID=48586 RepID=UPI001B87433B|nr:uncharacterized protein DFJ58DRAFT_848010 [Suillus subalutaceus]KAG1832561.1 hypothetical protein DFJ58DRAFT_848010 [Suillus subalutaceus]
MSLMTSNESNASEVTRESTDEDNDDDAIQQKSRKVKFISENDAIHQKLRAEIISASDTEETSTAAPNQLTLKNKISIIERNSLITLRVILHDDNARWASPQQQQAAVATLKRETDIIAMLKTGGGKSMLAILPSDHGHRQSSGRSPSFEVLDDRLDEKLKAMRVPFQVYDHSHPLSSSVNLILVSTDKARFRHGDSIWQSSMRSLPHRQLSRQCFGLLPTAIEIRESINRPELEVHHEATSSVQHSRDQDNPKQTRWPFYNGSKNRSDASRAQYYTDWRAGQDSTRETTILTSDSWFHLKTPLEMSEIIQAQGRAGRDGRPARCYIIPSTSPPKLPIGRSEPDHKGRWYAHDYVYTHGLKRCLRYGSTPLHRWRGNHVQRRPEKPAMLRLQERHSQGGRSSKGSHPNSKCTHVRNPRSIDAPSPRTCLPCNSIRVCLNHPPLRLTDQPSQSAKWSFNDMSGGADPFAEATAQSKKLKTAKQAEEMKRVDRMRNALNAMKDKGCTLCQASGEAEGQFHKLSRCPFWHTPGWSLGKYFEWKKEIRYNNHKGICWICHVPTCSDELQRTSFKGHRGQAMRMARHRPATGSGDPWVQ